MRKFNNQNTRKLMKIGRTSLAVTLPIAMLKALGWHAKQKVTATRVRGGILIRDFKNK